MDEKLILRAIFKDANVKRSALLAEHIVTIDKYLTISEEELNSVQWVDKKGVFEPMVPPNQIYNVVSKREIYLNGLESSEHKKEIENQAILLLNLPILKAFIVPFSKSSNIALKTALSINDVIELNNITAPSDSRLEKLDAMQRVEFFEFITQRKDWNYDLVKEIPEHLNIVVDTVLFLGRGVGISVDKNINLKIRKEVLKNWFSVKTNSQAFIEIISTHIPEFNSTDNMALLERIGVIFQLDEIQFKIILLFFKEVLKMEKDVPTLASNAITTGNPFLFRSLFLNFDEAKLFAVGGKLNSSLETKYGNLFERLMNVFKNCRGIYDGGMDVAVETNSFDIKSGPNVMNLSQVTAFLSKQRLINGGILPGITTYQIALGYGKSNQLNSFMSAIQDQILTGRDAWTKITGLSHSPELVFSLAGLSAKIFGFDNLVSSMLETGERYDTQDSDNKAFSSFFDSVFEPVVLNEVQKYEISFIDYLLP